MAEIRSFTIDGTNPEGVYNITVPIKAGATLLLVNSRVDIYYGANEPEYTDLIKNVNIIIGNSVTNYYVVDNNDKLNALRHKLKHNLQQLGVSNHWYNMSDYEPNMAYKIGGDLNTRLDISIRKDDGSLVDSTKLKYWHFQFQVL